MSICVYIYIHTHAEVTPSDASGPSPSPMFEEVESGLRQNNQIHHFWK